MPTEKQWRRSYSVKPETAVRLNRFCKRVRRKPTPTVEEALNAMLDAAGEASVSREEAIAEIRKMPRRTRSDHADYTGHMFSF